MCHANPSERSRFIRTVYGLLNATSAAVRYEAAGTLVTLSNAPAAIKVSQFTNLKPLKILKGVFYSVLDFVCNSHKKVDVDMCF